MKSKTKRKSQAVLITGCSSGIGLASAYKLRDAGYDVFATARQRKHVNRLKRLGFNSFRLDTDDSACVQAGFLWLISQNPNLYAVFNNAGWGIGGRLEDMPRDAMRAIFESNVFGAQELANLAVRHMREHKIAGRIVYNSSVLGYVTFRHRSIYCATKYAMESLADALRLEIAHTGIKVVIIEPGPITSNFRANAYEAYKRWIEPEKSLDYALYKAMEKRYVENLDKKEPFTLESTAVAKVLLKALRSSNPKPRYRVTIPAKIFWYLRRILPTRLLDKAVMKMPG